MKTVRRLDRVVGLMERFLAALSGIALGVLALLIVTDVVGRAMGWISIPWTVEVSQYWLISGTFLAAGWIFRQHAHPRVSAFDGLTNLMVKRIIGVLAVVITVAACAFGLYFALEIVQLQLERETQVGTFIRVPRWTVLSPIPIGFAFILYEAVAVTLRGAKGSAE